MAVVRKNFAIVALLFQTALLTVVGGAQTKHDQAIFQPVLAPMLGAAVRGAAQVPLQYILLPIGLQVCFRVRHHCRWLRVRKERLRFLQLARFWPGAGHTLVLLVKKDPLLHPLVPIADLTHAILLEPEGKSSGLTGPTGEPFLLDLVLLEPGKQARQVTKEVFPLGLVVVVTSRANAVLVLEGQLQVKRPLGTAVGTVDDANHDFSPVWYAAASFTISSTRS